MQSPTQYCSALKLNSELDSWQSTSPTLRQIEKKGDKICIALLVKLLIDLANSLNIGKNMDDKQIIDAAQILFDEFNHLKLNDVVLCFNKIKRGHYGTIYDRLDVHVIMEKMHRFEADQAEQIEYFRQRENNELKRLNNTPIIPSADAISDQKAAEHIRKLKALLDKPKAEAKIIRSEMTADKFSKYFALFNKLADSYWQNKGGVPAGKVFIKRYGKMLDVTEFVQHKSYQMRLANERSLRWT